MSQTLPKLISTDFDGTLVHHDHDPVDFRPLWEFLTYLQEAHGVLWAINTGRDLDFTLCGLEDYQITAKPDFLLTMEREIHLPAQEGGSSAWVPHLAWNERCQEDHLALEQKITPQLHSFHQFLKMETTANPVIEGGRFVGIEASTEQELAQIVLRMEDFFAKATEFSYQRNGIYLRFCHINYHKGAVLQELSRMLSLEPSQVCAAGDNFNDLAMLEPTSAEYLIAPVNAIPEVKEALRKHRGIIAEEIAGLGVLQALKTIFMAKEA
ncbi:MAG: HAD family phosphatase [Opitutales bacterium]|nr:HAD family phosphatase [Opitutales bacterium]MCH8540423.1 Cof-type HAD-IIB family hydrolase [Opitutales bacterium]